MIDAAIRLMTAPIRWTQASSSGYLLALTTLLLGVVALWPAIISLIREWLQWGDAFSHGWLNAVLALWLTIRVLRRQTDEPRYRNRVSILLLVLSLGMGAAFLAHVELAYQVLLPVWMAAFLAALFGGDQFKAFLKACGILYFAIPIWDYSNLILQFLSATVSGWILGVLGIEAHIDGIFVNVERGIFEVADGCSGLRYLLVSLTLAYLHNSLHIQRALYRQILFAIAFGLALITNWIRVVVIIYIGHRDGMEAPLVQDHEFFGWLMYGANLIPLMMAAHYLELRDKRERPASSSTPLKSLLQLPATGRFIVAIAVGLAIPLAAQLSSTLGQPEQDFATIRLADSRPGATWSRLAVIDNLYVEPAYHHFTQSLDASFSGGGKGALVTLCLRQYSRQQNRAELVNRSNREFVQKEWTLLRQLPSEIPEVTLLHLQHQATGDEFLLAYTYQVGSQRYNDRFAAKVGQLTAFLLENRSDGSLIQASTPCNGDCIDARARLSAFLTDQLDSLSESLFQAYLKSR